MLGAFAERVDPRDRLVSKPSSTTMPRLTCDAGAVRQGGVGADADGADDEVGRDHAAVGQFDPSTRAVADHRAVSAQSTTSMPAPRWRRRSSAAAGASSWRSISRSIRWMSVTAHARPAPARRRPRGRAARRRSHAAAPPPAPRPAHGVAMSARSRNVMTPGRSMPGFGRRIGCEPVAKTSLANGRIVPSARLTCGLAVSTASTARPNTVVTPLAPPPRRGLQLDVALRHIPPPAATTAARGYRPGAAPRR